jgi:MFS family permease
LAYAAISLGFIFFKDIHALIALRFFQGIASAMLMPIIQAYIGDITPPGNEGFTMGLFNMSMFCGLSIGPFLGGFIHDYFSLQTSFACMGLLALIGFFLSLFLLPPAHSENTSIAVSHRLIGNDYFRSGILSVFFFLDMPTSCASELSGPFCRCMPKLNIMLQARPSAL